MRRIKTMLALAAFSIIWIFAAPSHAEAANCASVGVKASNSVCSQAQNYETTSSQGCGPNTICSMVNSFLPEISGIEPLMFSLSYIFGLTLGIKAAFKLREHNESKGQVKLSVPIMMLIAAAMFLSLPTLMDSGISTLGLGTASQSTFKY